MAEKEIKELKKLYHKHKDVKITVEEDDLIEITWKHRQSTVRLDLSSYPDGTTFFFFSFSRTKVLLYRKERTNLTGRKVL